MVDLKRFNQGAMGLQRGGFRQNEKNNDFVDLGDLTVRIEDEHDGGTDYELCSMICHFGTLNAGHYTAFAKISEDN